MLYADSQANKCLLPRQPSSRCTSRTVPSLFLGRTCPRWGLLTAERRAHARPHLCPGLQRLGLCGRDSSVAPGSSRQAVPLAWTGIHSPYAAFDSSKSPCKVGRLQACRVRIGASFGIGIFAVQGVGYHSGDGGAGGKMKYIYIF